MRLVLSLLAVSLFAAGLLAGCGSGEPGDSGATAPSRSTTAAQGSPEEPTVPAPAGASARRCEGGSAAVANLRATAVDCGTAQTVAAAWTGKPGCASPAGDSRYACSVGSYRCLGAATERGIEVSCARSGRSIAFVVRRG